MNRPKASKWANLPPWGVLTWNQREPECFGDQHQLFPVLPVKTVDNIASPFSHSCLTIIQCFPLSSLLILLGRNLNTVREHGHNLHVQWLTKLFKCFKLLEKIINYSFRKICKYLEIFGRIGKYLSYNIALSYKTWFPFFGNVITWFIT